MGWLGRGLHLGVALFALGVGVAPVWGAPASRPFRKTIRERSQLSHEVVFTPRAPGTNGSEISIHRLEASPQLNVEVAPEFTLKTAFRARAEIPRQSQKKESYEAEARLLVVEKRFNLGRISLGLQEVSWGETFGFPVADVVNPRDFREPLFFDSSRTRIPLAMVNLQLMADDWDMQLIGVPLPRTSPSIATYRWVRDGEGGGRLGYRFGSFALQAQGYVHWSRDPLLVNEGSLQIPKLNWYQKRVATYGISFSDGYETSVFRGDVMMHQALPVAGGLALEPPEVRDQVQSVLGFDWSGDGGWNLGLQFHADIWTVRPPLKSRSEYYFASARYRDSFFYNRLETSLFAFAGLGSADVWVRPTITWNVSGSWRVEVEGNYIEGDSRSEEPALFANQSHVGFRTSYNY